MMAENIPDISITNGDKKEEDLPPIGTKFMVHGKEYEVCYINYGKKRFSATPCKGAY